MFKVFKEKIKSKLKNSFLKEDNPIDEIFNTIRKNIYFETDVVAIIIANEFFFYPIIDENLIKMIFENEKFKDFLDGTFNEKICFLSSYEKGNFYQKYVNSKILMTDCYYDEDIFKRLRNKYIDNNNILINYEYFEDLIEHKKILNFNLNDMKVILFNGVNENTHIHCITKFCKYILYISCRGNINFYNLPEYYYNFFHKFPEYKYIRFNLDKIYTVEDIFSLHIKETYKKINSCRLNLNDSNVDNFEIRLYKKQHKKEC